MIVAGEASADMHGAGLVRALKEKRPDLAICGMGGSELSAAGVEILYDASLVSVVGLVEVFGHLRHILRAMKILKIRLKNAKPSLLILLDLPDFNLRLAAYAKKLGIPVLYYISPQIWAWRTGRVKKIARLVDRMAVILPFEEEFYRKQGMRVDFVGHPLVDSINDLLGRHAEELPTSSSDSIIMGIMPGSRKKELVALLAVFFETCRLLAERLTNIEFYLFCAPGVVPASLQAQIPEDLKGRVCIIEKDRYEFMRRCAAVIVASGTATLELALLNTPMVVAYRMAPLTFWLASRLVKVPFVSLVNLVAGRQIVPELLQEKVSAEGLREEVLPLLTEGSERRRMLNGFTVVRQKLSQGGASGRAAEIALDMIKCKE
jgi:lipid-A-disaccharide synthase